MGAGAAEAVVKWLGEINWVIKKNILNLDAIGFD